MSTNNEIIINGRSFSFEDGDTILEVAENNNIYIPTLCHLKGTIPTGACRVCVVEVEGARNLVASCAAPASKNMVVKTDSPKVIKARRFVIAFLIASGNHNCSSRGNTFNDWCDFQLEVNQYDKTDEICDAYGVCKLQELAYRYQVTELISDLRLGEMKQTYSIEDVNPYIIRDFSRCILCGRCVKACNEIQVNNAISIGYRGSSAKIVTSSDAPLVDSDCVFCGDCLQVCPVGALVLKDIHNDIRPWDLDLVESTCTYCGTGCSIDIYTKDNKIVKISGSENGIVNKGSLCIKGRFGFDFVHSKDRLTKPLVKSGDDFKEVEWDEALNLISSKLSEFKDKNGSDSIAGLSSARCTNEDNYIMQKFFRATIGTNNIDHCARL